MGVLGNIIAALAVRNHNRHHYHMNSRLIDFMPDSVNLIVCGGRNGNFLPDGKYEGSIADEIKAEAFYASCEQFLNRDYGAVALYNKSHVPSVAMNQIEMKRDRVLEFGVNVSYTPLNTSIAGRDGTRRVYDFFERIVLSYCNRIKCESTVILGCIKMVLDLLYHSLGGEYLTYTNIKKIVSALNVNSQLDFYDYMSHQFHMSLPREWDFFLTLNWEEIQKKFIPFWNEFNSSVSSRNSISPASESLLSGLLTGKLCIADARSKTDLFIDIALSELILVHELNVNYGLIDYYVPLKGIQEYRYDEGRICKLIGDSFDSIGIAQTNIVNPVCICLGVNASDARDIIRQMVASGNIIETNMGFTSHGSHVGFSNNVRGIITEDMLSRIPDGSAYRLDSQGFTLIHSLLG